MDKEGHGQATRAMKALKTKFLKIAFKGLVSYSNFK
jgi:hypothetical protein